LLKQYQSLGKRKFGVFELREKLGLKSTELRQWIDFRRRVLEIAKREINAKTDLEIDYKTKKVGRKIEFIIFSIRAQSREQKNEQNERYDALLNLVPDKYRELKTLKNAIIKYLKKKGFEYVKRNIEYANLKAEKNYRAYLINALKEDWSLAWWEDQKIEKEKIEIQEKKEKEKEEKEKEELQQYLNLIKKYVGKKVRLATIGAFTGVMQADGSLQVIRKRYRSEKTYVHYFTWADIKEYWLKCPQVELLD
jgi:plasmid replication initiation protein